MNRRNYGDSLVNQLANRSNYYPRTLRHLAKLLNLLRRDNAQSWEVQIVLNVNEDNQRVDTAVVIQDNLKAIGINAQIKTYQWASYVAFVENSSQKKGMFLMAWNIANDDPDELLYPLYHRSQIDAHTNVVFYKDEDIDSLISKARETIDKEKRIDLYKKAQDIIQEDLPHYAILYPMQNFAYKKNIKGIEVNKRGYFNFQNTMVE